MRTKQVPTPVRQPWMDSKSKGEKRMLVMAVEEGLSEV